MTDDKHRRQWMAMLAKMVCPMDAASATKALCDMLPMMTNLEEAYFSAESLAFVAGRCKRTPSFAELKAHFGAWWQENLPPDTRVESEYPRLESQPRRGPTDVEKHIAAETVRALKAEIASSRKLSIPDEKLRPTPLPLSDLHLLEAHRQLAAQGNRASLTRVEHLKRKLGLDDHAQAAE